VLDPRVAAVVWDEGSAGAAARAMLAQDARWIADAMLSAQSGEGWLPLVLLGHSARIVYEGSIALRSANPAVGVPELAQTLESRHDDVIARSRHGGKFLDDKRKSFDDLRAEMLGFYDAHRDEFMGNALWFARWLESDIGIFLAPGERILGTTIALHFRTGLGKEVHISDAGPVLLSVAQAQGEALAAFAVLGGDESTLTATIDYEGLGRLGEKDRRVIRYLRDRYDPGMDVATKLLLLMVEGEVNTTDQVVPLGSSTHPEATFRARLISVFHSLRAVDEILISQPSAASLGTQRVRSLLSEQATRRVLDDPQLRRVRNRCMHYEIRDRSIDLDLTRPMFGIVEGLCPESTFDELDAELRELSSRLGDALHHWRTRS